MTVKHVPGERGYKFWRRVWGVLFLLALAWLAFGFLLPTLSDLMIQSCIGLPFAFLFGLLYWRNGVALRQARQHAEQVEAISRA